MAFTLFFAFLILASVGCVCSDPACTPCSSTCGQGIQRCSDGQSRACNTRPCNTACPPCTTRAGAPASINFHFEDGQPQACRPCLPTWTSWGNWTVCLASGTQRRTRSYFSHAHHRLRPGAGDPQDFRNCTPAIVSSATNNDNFLQNIHPHSALALLIGLPLTFLVLCFTGVCCVRRRARSRKKLRVPSI